MKSYKIKVQLRGGSGYLETVELTEKEVILFLNKNDINGCWSKLCQSIEDRLGMRIIGHFNLVSYFIDDEEFPLH